MQILQLYSGQRVRTGDFFYRIQQPCDGLNRLNNVRVTNIDLLSVAQPELLIRAPFLILHHLTDPDLLPIVKERRQRFLPTVYELADDFRHAHSHESASPNSTPPDYHAVIEALLKRCDAVQTTGPQLAGRYRHLNSNIFVFPNLVQEIRNNKRPQKRYLTVGWGGSARHFQDLAACADALISWVKQHPEVRLAIMGAAEIRALFAGKLPERQLWLTPGGSMKKYLNFLDSLDIGIAPLLPTPFNACRSDVKFLEYASRGVVPVCSAHGPYLHLPAPGKTVLLFKTPSELISHLEALRQSSSLRRRLVEQAQKWLQQNRLATEENWLQRIKMYRTLVNCEMQEIRVNDEGIDFRLADALKQGIAVRDPELSKQTLEALFERHPKNYQVAYFYGWSLSRSGKYHEAIAVLRRALRLHPASIRTAQLLAQTQILAGDVDGALATVKLALQIDPNLRSLRQLRSTVTALRNQIQKREHLQLSQQL